MAGLINAPILVADEVGRILENGKPDRERLGLAVKYLKSATGVDVCTIYRGSPKSGDIFMVCTEGLDKSREGLMALKRGEGLTGMVIETARPLPVRDGPSHPRFRYIPALREEAFHSFLGVPLMEQADAVGALVIQTRMPRDFSREDIALLSSVARQIAPVAASVFAGQERQADLAANGGAPSEDDSLVRGRSIAPGCYVGTPIALDQSMKLDTLVTPASEGVDVETKAIRRANRKVMAELEREARAVSGSEEGQAVLMAHKVLLEDPEMAEEVLGLVRKGNSAAEAVRLTGVKWIERLENLSDPLFASRAHDFRDIAIRLLRALGIEADEVNLGEGKIVALARAVLPGDLLRLGAEKFGAMILTDQGVYSHTAILARSFGIPAIQIDPARLEGLRRAQRVLVDGTEGLALADPSPQVVAEYMARAESVVTLPPGGPSDLSGPVRTLDGVEIHIDLNAGLLVEFEGIDKIGPEHIGLYRTEIAFMSRDHLPGVREQAEHYRRVLEAAGGRGVVFRTFDFGGDKIPASLRFEREDNPMMGCRSTRFMLERPELFQTQLKALLSVSAGAPMTILLPMISTPEEFNLALDEINAIKNEMDRAGEPFNRDVKIGAMLEVPSVLFQIDELSRAADFFCVGSNDLVQYLMAADRSNSRVAWLYQWHHPAALVALDRLARHGERNGRPVALCGEMAGHPWAAMLLAGMGYKSLSIDGRSIPAIKWTLMQCRWENLRRLAHAVMRATSSTEVIELLFAELEEIRRATPPLARLLEASLDRLREHTVW